MLLVKALSVSRLTFTSIRRKLHLSTHRLRFDTVIAICSISLGTHAKKQVWGKKEFSGVSDAKSATFMTG